MGNDMRRAWLMAQNKCSPGQYRRMVKEKAEAAALSGLTFLSSGGRASARSLRAPWHAGARADAKRLRKKIDSMGINGSGAQSLA